MDTTYDGVIEIDMDDLGITGLRLVDLATCGTCGRSWDDSVVTAWTPAPSGRCPFEYEHEEN